MDDLADLVLQNMKQEEDRGLFECRFYDKTRTELEQLFPDGIPAPIQQMLDKLR